MVANPQRRAEITDVALEILGTSGGHGLTHRAVDRAAGLPIGSTANYFPSKSSLYLAMAERIFDRLSPDPDRLDQLAKIEPAQAVVEYAVYATERLLTKRTLALALIELRLEASRQPQVREALQPFLRQGFALDSTFHAQRGLAGGDRAVLVLHHLVTGVVLDALTVPLDPSQSPLEQVRQTVTSLFT